MLRKKSRKQKQAERPLNPELVANVEQLIVEKQGWEKQELSTHLGLYHLLSDVMRLLEDYGLQALCDLAKSKGQKINSKSSDHAISVKLVFGTDDRRRTSAYSAVLKKAEAAGVTPDGFADWITDKGGIEAVRLDNPNDPASKRGERVEKGRKLLMEREALAEIPMDLLPEDQRTGDSFRVLVIRPGSGSHWDVVMSGDDAALLDSAFILAVKNQSGLTDATDDASGEDAEELSGVIEDAFDSGSDGAPAPTDEKSDQGVAA